MSQIKFEQTKFGSFLQSKGFYLALGLCLLAIGAASWVAVTGFDQPEPLGENDLSYISIAPPRTSSAGQVAGMVSDVPVPQSSMAPAPSAIASSAPQTTNGKLLLPVAGDVMKAFSSTELQFSETYQDFRLHEAVDIETEEGAAVKAAAGGTVTDIYSDALWGVTLVIDHGNGIVGYYSGMDKDVKVKKNQTVTSGQQLGGVSKIPCEGSDPVHLHFAVKKDGKWVNPIELMN